MGLRSTAGYIASLAIGGILGNYLTDISKQALTALSYESFQLTPLFVESLRPYFISAGALIGVSSYFFLYARGIKTELKVRLSVDK